MESVEYDTGDRVKIDLVREKDKFISHTWDGRLLPLNLRNPPEKARAIRSLRGSLVVQTPAASDEWTFDRLEERAQVEREGAKATILGVANGTTEEVRYVALFFSVRGPAFGEMRLSPLGGTGEAMLLSKEGREAPWVPGYPPRYTWSAHSQTVEVEARFLLPKDSAFEPAMAVLRIAREFETVELPFEIRDIPLR